jgi:hypothetical protein
MGCLDPARPSHNLTKYNETLTNPDPGHTDSDTTHDDAPVPRHGLPRAAHGFQIDGPLGGLTAQTHAPNTL